MTSLSFTDLRPLTAGLPKIVALTNILWGPISGICKGLLDAGAECKIITLDASKHMLTKYASTLVPHTTTLCENGKPLLLKYAALATVPLQKYPLRHRQHILFAPCLPGGDLAAHPWFAEANLVFVGHAHGLFTPQRMQYDTFKDKILVHRLSDMTGFSALCIYAAGCEKFKETGCARCPMLGAATDGSNLAAAAFRAKQAGYAKMKNMSVVTPSEWLGRYAKESILLREFSQTTIPTGVDLAVFTPQAREYCRKHFSLPPDRKILLCGAALLDRGNKGFSCVVKALELLQGQWRGTPPLLAFFGNNPPEYDLPAEYDSVYLGYLATTVELAMAYGAADVFVAPSFQDNLPNAVNEALSCGTPVVCFNRFCSEDVVEDGVNGYLAEHPGLPFTPDSSPLQTPMYSVAPEKLEDLAAKIQHILALPDDEYAAMRLRCRAKALEDFSPVLQAARYLQLFRRLLNLPEISFRMSESREQRAESRRYYQNLLNNIT